MLHIFFQPAGDFRHGTTGKAVPGYELKLVDERGDEVKQGELGGASSRADRSQRYWNNRAKTAAPSSASGRAAATSTARTPTASTPTAAAPTTC
jgi:acyl-coenzyme A synthetase/AMP-(fatty) acid ligase